MTRNLSLIPTIEAEPEAEPPAAPPRAAPATHDAAWDRSRRVAIVPARPARMPECERTPQGPRHRIAIEVLECTGIVLLFLAIAWPLYLWIGK